MATIKTIEEKAKAYDEAIKALRSLFSEQAIKHCDRVYIKDITNIFLELKESEDERIAKNLKYLVENYMGTGKYFGIEARKYIAWLEKQGKNNMGISEATKKKLEDNLNKALEKETPESFNEFLDEQKPAWSKEDEDILNTIINHFKVDIECTDEDDVVRWLKSLKERFNK